MKNTKKFILGIIFIVLSFTIFINFNEKTTAQSSDANVGGGEIVPVNEITVCCEKTKSGLFCQDVPENECAGGAKAIPTSCDATALCKSGWCFDDVQGTCLDGVAQSVCNNEGGTWYDTKPPACELGCCFLGDQASFVSLTRCKALSADYGIKTNFNTEFKDEPSCILAAGAQEKGACVFVKDFEKTCEFTTRGDCTAENMYNTGQTVSNTNSSGGTSPLRVEGLTPAPQTQNTPTENQNTNNEDANQQNNQNANQGSGNNAPATGNVITGRVVSGFENETVEFFPGKLCSAPELQTNCGLSKETICAPGKQEVYFKDTCGNAANIYDAGKVNDVRYWTDVVLKENSCGANAADGNVNSQSCGNCLYLAGSYCREKSSATATATYGDNICASLNCVDIDGEKRIHGESWCGNDVKFEDVGRNAVGSKYYRYQCNNGEIVIEPCAEFRQEECIENSLETPLGKFSESACRVNRWQDCTAQRDAQTCLNTDRRDCLWLDGIEYILMGSVLSGGENGTSAINDKGSLTGIGKRAKAAVKEAGGLKNIPRGACVPKNPPGLNFWSEGEAKSVCSQANAACPVTKVKGLLGDDWEYADDEITQICIKKETEIKRAQVCTAMGDCGLNINIVGQVGSNKGYKITEQDLGKK